MINLARSIIKCRRAVLVAALFSVFSLTSCGDMLAPPEEEAMNLAGSWIGPTTLLTSGEQQAEVTLRLTEKEFTFESSEEQKAEGEYELFGDSYIRFKVKTSTAPLFPENQTILMELAQKGQTIELSTGEYKLILMKTSDSSEKVDSTVISPENAFISSACTMNVNNSARWDFSFDKAETFTLRIGQNANFAIGSMDFVGSENKVKLNITKTSVANLSELHIFVEYTQKTKFLVTVNAKDGSEIHKGDCYVVSR